MSLNSGMISAGINAREKPWRGRPFTSPNGNVFRWNKDVPPSAAELALMAAADKELAPLTGPMFEDAQRRGINLTPELRLSIQKAALNNQRTQQYEAEHPNVGTFERNPNPQTRIQAAASEQQLYEDVAKTPGPKQSYAKKALKIRENSLTPGQRAVKGAGEATESLAGAIKPVLGPVGRVLGTASDYLSPLGAAGTKALTGQSGGDLGAQMLPSTVAGIITAPVHGAAEVMQLSDPSVKAMAKARAAANLILMAVPVEELTVGGAKLALGKVLTKMKAKNFAEFQAIEKALQNGHVTEVAIEKAVQKELPKIGAPTKEIGYAPATYKTKYPGIDITDEVGARKALPQPTSRLNPEELPQYEPGTQPNLKEEAFVRQHWEKRTQGLLNAVRTQMANTKGAGRRLAPLARDLEKSLQEGKPHPGIDQELRDIYQRQNPSEPAAPTQGETNAPQTRIVQKRGIGEYPNGNSGRQAAEASSGNRPLEGGQGEAEIPQSQTPGTKEASPGNRPTIQGSGSLGGRIGSEGPGGSRSSGRTQEVRSEKNGPALSSGAQTQSQGLTGKATTETQSGVLGAQGISHADIDSLRQKMGWEPRGKTSKPDAELASGATKYTGHEETLAESVLADKKGKRVLSDEEGLALAKRLSQLKEEMSAAKQTGDVEAYDLANDAAAKIADALDESGSRQGRAFRARQFYYQDQFDAWSLKRRAEKANLGEALAPKRQGVLDERIKEVEATNAALKSERDAAIKRYEGLLAQRRSTPRPSGPKTTSQRRTAALSALKRLGVPVAEGVKPGATLGGGKMPSRRSGAISIPAGEIDKIAQGVRSLVRTYADEGAQSWGDVVKLLQRDLPGIDEDQALFILSGEYKQAKLTADIAKKKALGFMQDVKREAEFRSKPFAEKALSVGADILNTTQRTLQTTLDNSMALIQGKNVLTWKPGTWFKGVGTSMRAFVTKDPIGFARKISAEIENHPLYSRAVQAKLALSDIDGAFSHQEEFFAGHLENVIPGLSHSKAAATVMMNKMRFDLFRKLAAAGPDTPEYLADIARQINIATGKGTGKVAEILGSKPAGLVAYAPRYYLSKWQHNFGVPIFAAKSSAGRLQALKMYGTQLAFYGALIKASQLFGFNVELDPRSTNFGVASGKDYSFDLFKQQSEGFRTLAQLVYGRTSRKGEYKAPGDFGAYSLGDYLQSKESPILRSATMLTTGKTYDDEQGGYRDVEPADFWRSYISMSAREIYKNRKVPGTAPLSFFGGNVDLPLPETNPEHPAPKFEVMPPGLKTILGAKP